jgi:hypothetical protein
MQELIAEKDWAGHEFLRRVSVHTDFDGWYNYYTIKSPTAEDREFAKKVSIEFRENEGPWVAAGFEESVTFIDFSSFAWDRSFVYRDQDPDSFTWRAVIKIT